jgi:hypothetical protein
MFVFVRVCGMLETSEFFRRAAAQLLPPGTLRLGANITRVERPAAGATGSVTIHYTTTAENVVVRCGALLNTAAQTVPNLAYLAPDAEEQRLFARVRTTRYFSTALVVDPKLQTGGHAVLPPPGNANLFTHSPAGAVDAGDAPQGQPVLPALASIVDPWPYRGDVTVIGTVTPGEANRPSGVPFSAAPGLAVAYSYSDVDVTEAEVAANATRSVSGSTRAAIARKVFSWPLYSPRLREADLRAGWFEQAERMQGRRATYHAGAIRCVKHHRCLRDPTAHHDAMLHHSPRMLWDAGGLFTFWTVDHAMRSGQELVERYF